MVDDAVAHLSEVRQRTVWQPLSDAAKDGFKTAAPQQPTALAEVYDRLRTPCCAIRSQHPSPLFRLVHGKQQLYRGGPVFWRRSTGRTLAAAMADIQVVDCLRELMGCPDGFRAAIVNHRTRRQDVKILVAEVLRWGAALQAEVFASA